VSHCRGTLRCANSVEKRGISGRPPATPVAALSRPGYKTRGFQVCVVRKNQEPENGPARE